MVSIDKSRNLSVNRDGEFVSFKESYNSSDFDGFLKEPKSKDENVVTLYKKQNQRLTNNA